MSAIPEVPDPAELSASEHRRVTQALLADVLAAARRGDLEVGWRDDRPAAALSALQQCRPRPPLSFDELYSAYDSSDPLAPLAALEKLPVPQESLYRAYSTILDVVTTQSVSAWEPGAGASARDALESWYSASVQCAATELADLPEIPQGDDERSQRIALSIGPAVVRWHAEHQQRVDLLTESYEAGLVSIGAGDCGWVDRSRQRVANWPEILGFSRDAQLWLLDDPLYQASRELLPPYWRAAV